MSEKIYKLVYAFSDYGLVINFLQPVLIISLMILGFLYLKKQIAPILLHEIVLSLISISLILYFSLNHDISNLLNIRNLYKNNMVSLVEGEVADFSPIAYNARGFEHFKVNGVKFSYRDDHNQACYNKTKEHGGAITHNGQQVKIYYVNSCIVELWVVSSPTVQTQETQGVGR